MGENITFRSQVRVKRVTRNKVCDIDVLYETIGVNSYKTIVNDNKIDITWPKQQIRIF